MILDHQFQVHGFRSGDAVHARLLGPLNCETTGPAQERLEALLSGDRRAIALDLGGADYVDSDGVRWLQRFRDELAGRGVELRLLLRQGSRIERTLDLLRLTGSFRIERYPAE